MRPDWPARDHAEPDELDQLQYIAADAAGVAEPALLVEPDVKRAVRLAPVVRAIAEQGLPRFLRDAAAEEFAGDLADVDIGDLPVVSVDIYRRRSHCRVSGWSRKERKVFRRSTWRLAAQLSMPHRSPRRITESLARVTAVYSRLRWCMKECDLWAITTAQGNSDPCTLWIDVA